MNRPSILQSASRALAKGADVLSTLVYLLHPPEASQHQSGDGYGQWVELGEDEPALLAVPPET